MKDRRQFHVGGQLLQCHLGFCTGVRHGLSGRLFRGQCRFRFCKNVRSHCRRLFVLGQQIGLLRHFKLLLLRRGDCGGKFRFSRIEFRTPSGKVGHRYLKREMSFDRFLSLLSKGCGLRIRFVLIPGGDQGCLGRIDWLSCFDIGGISRIGRSVGFDQFRLQRLQRHSLVRNRLLDGRQFRRQLCLFRRECRDGCRQFLVVGDKLGRFGRFPGCFIDGVDHKLFGGRFVL